MLKYTINICLSVLKFVGGWCKKQFVKFEVTFSTGKEWKGFIPFSRYGVIRLKSLTVVRDLKNDIKNMA